MNYVVCMLSRLCDYLSTLTRESMKIPSYAFVSVCSIVSHLSSAASAIHQYPISGLPLELRWDSVRSETRGG